VNIFSASNHFHRKVIITGRSFEWRRQKSYLRPGKRSEMFDNKNIEGKQIN
jgi:hypothetical protein